MERIHIQATWEPERDPKDLALALLEILLALEQTEETDSFLSRLLDSETGREAA